MCGVAGAMVLDGSGFRVTAPYLERMRDSMAHRGPDGAGTWVDDGGRVGLAHRRLSIIDLSERAAQPMANEDGSVRISFNGEIYNHAEIRAELERTGRHRWRTDHSDTEVILHAFEEWGIECLHRFRGMFAFALWDGRARELWLVRDRIGIKPMYYGTHHGRITFASEIKALLADPEQPRAVDEEAFFHSLAFLTTPAPSTLFAGIRKLPGGCWLRVRPDGDTRLHRWYEVWDHVEPLRGVPDGEIAARVLDEVRAAVHLRAVSDVPVGVFLSGGVDSSTCATLLAETASGPLHTFSIGYDGEYDSYRSELGYARRVADGLGAAHAERILSLDDLVRFLPEMVRLQDEPVADPVCVPVFYVSELARRSGVVVCQVGEGADELFWGYPSWKRALRMQRISGLMPRAVRSLGMAGVRASGRGDGRAYELLRRGSEGVPLFWGGAEGFTDARQRRLLSPRLRRSLDGVTSWDALRPIRERFEAGAWERSPLAWMSFLDLNLRLPELLLMRVDKMSMGAGVEGRVPFLDHKVVELALAIPQAARTRGGNLKHVLKTAVRGVIPDEVIDRPKQGFGVPVREWLLGRLGGQARRELEDVCAQTDFLDPAAVRRTLDSGDTAGSWQLLNFAHWWKEYLA